MWFSLVIVVLDASSQNSTLVGGRQHPFSQVWKCMRISWSSSSPVFLPCLSPFCKASLHEMQQTIDMKEKAGTFSCREDHWSTVHFRKNTLLGVEPVQAIQITHTSITPHFTSIPKPEVLEDWAAATASLNVASQDGPTAVNVGDCLAHILQSCLSLCSWRLVDFTNGYSKHIFAKVLLLLNKIFVKCCLPLQCWDWLCSLHWEIL